MHDIRLLREHPEVLDAAMAKRHGSWDKERFLSLDQQRREVIQEVEALQAKRNSSSKEIGALMKDGRADEAAAMREEVASMKDRIAELDARRDELEGAETELVSHIPNIPAVISGHVNSCTAVVAINGCIRAGVVVSLFFGENFILIRLD